MLPSTQADKNRRSQYILRQFIAKVKKITYLTGLSLGKIVVSDARYLDSRRIQIVDIYCKGIGTIRGFSPEELVEIFQKGKSCGESGNPAQQERLVG